MDLSQYIGFLETPPIWKGVYTDIQQFDLPNIELDTFVPNPIPKNLRLGHQMEYVYKAVIDQTAEYEILIHNLPVRRVKITLGEIDFILKEKSTGQLIHIELAYKFYVIDPELGNSIEQLIGPNRKDTFAEKLAKIRTKQFPLLHIEDGAEVLGEFNIDHSKIQHQCCFKAQLFEPYELDYQLSGKLNSACIIGYWVRMDKFRKGDFAKDQFYIPSKSEWVILPNDNVDWRRHSKIIVDLRGRINDERSPLIWRKKVNGEIEKFFLVWW